MLGLVCQRWHERTPLPAHYGTGCSCDLRCQVLLPSYSTGMHDACMQLPVLSLKVLID